MCGLQTCQSADDLQDFFVDADGCKYCSVTKFADMD